MKYTQENFRKFKKGLKAVALTCAFTFANSASAQVVWLFEEVGNDVRATASGSFALDYTSNSSNGNLDETVFGNNTLVSTSAAAGRRFTSNSGFGTAIPGLTYNFSSDDGPINGTFSFGTSSKNLLWDERYGETTLVAGTAINTRFLIPNVTLDTVFAGSNLQAQGDNVTVWTSSSNPSDMVQIFRGAAVPEPSGTSLIGLGVLGLIARRRR
jgi:hypothetical protein